MTKKEQLEFYKREMNNRETNFNKIFNKSTIIGGIGASSTQSLSVSYRDE
jgi:hypothetical protein